MRVRDNRGGPALFGSMAGLIWAQQFEINTNNLLGLVMILVLAWTICLVVGKAVEAKVMATCIGALAGALVYFLGERVIGSVGNLAVGASLAAVAGAIGGIMGATSKEE